MSKTRELQAELKKAEARVAELKNEIYLQMYKVANERIVEGEYSVSPVIIRYTRVKEPSGLTSNLGGITYAFRIYHDQSICAVGVSVLDGESNFNKSIGWGIATKRLEESPISFPYNGMGDLVDNLWDAVFQEDCDVSMDSIGVYKKLKEVILQGKI